MKRPNSPSKNSKPTPESPQPSTSSVVTVVKRKSIPIRDVLQETARNQIPPQAAKQEKLPLAPKKRLRTEYVRVLKPAPTFIRTAYSVLWANKGTRPYSKWDGNGILEIIGRYGLVKDEKGTKIGVMSNLSADMIKPGLILSAGRVDIEIKELIPTGSQKVISVKPVIPKEPVDTRRHLPSEPHTNPEPPADLLVMPKPTKEHQSRFNIKKIRVKDVTVTYCLARVLKPYQRHGVVFMYGCVTGIRNINQFGAILTDEMVMGKTLQVITLIWTLLHQGPYGGFPTVRKVLIVCPNNLTIMWEREFYKWLGRGRISVFVSNSRRLCELASAPQPVYVMSYEFFIQHYATLSKLPFELIIYDEGHSLKTSSHQAISLLGKLPCKRRMILTMSRIQYNLSEFFVLVNFVNPGCLGTREQYTDYFVSPILAAREPTATEHAKALGRVRSTRLHELTDPFILRRPQGILGAYLPIKTETVVFCKSTPLQQDLYAGVVRAWHRNYINKKKRLDPLNTITMLKKICNHPSLIMNEIRGTVHRFPGSLRLYLPADSVMKLEDSGKVKVLLNLLNRVTETEEKIVIISSYRHTLGMLANLCDVKDYQYVSLDSTVPAPKRVPIVTLFNNPWDKTFIFLLCTDAGCAGLNLCGATRMVLYDNEWAPDSGVNELCRIWKDEHLCSAYLYRFLTTGTLEEKIYQRHVTEPAPSNTVVDPANTSSIQFSDEQLNELFSYEFDVDSATHTLLKCTCKCDGKETESESELDTTESALGLNHLMKWEHHKPPYTGANVDSLLLSDAYDDISFMFCTHK